MVFEFLIWVLIIKFSFKFFFKEKINYFNMKVREKLFIGIVLKIFYKSIRKMCLWIFDNICIWFVNFKKFKLLIGS